MVAIVGARNASANGMRFASMLAADLAASGLVVVSGLARGIDAAAHEGAGPGATIAVQAGGADIPYPSENARLHAAIVAGGGCVASERPLGARPMAHHFPQRNRIVSGLCEAVVVVEATQRSGSLITARLGLEQGRDVLAVPGFPLDPRAAGPNSLLRDGAAPVLGAEDVLAALGRHAPATRPPDDVSPTPPEGMEMLPDQDDRARMALLELELAGMIRRHPGNQVSLVT
jgi:DNA processing protein